MEIFTLLGDFVYSIYLFFQWKALDKTYVYEYNNIGNVTLVKEYDYYAPDEELPSCQKCAKYEYDAECPDKLTKFDGNAIEYNSIGCPSKYKDENYEWANGKLSQIHRSTFIRDEEHYTTRTFTYDGYGRRTQKHSVFGVNYFGADAVNSYSHSHTNDYTYDNNGRLIREVYTRRDSSGTVSETRELVYLYDESGMIGVMYNSQPYYYHRNLQGDVIAIYDANGEKQVEYAYDAWGNCEVICADTQWLAHINPIRYRGYYYDTETGLYYLNARYYSPEWRRFISPDAAEYIDPETPNGLNLYAYCYNDPVNYADPSGNLPQWAEWLIGGAVIGLVALGAVFLPGAAGVIMGAAFYGAVTSAVGGAILGGVIGGIAGGWEGVLDGAANGFMWGAISGAVSGALTSGINIATGHLKIVGSAQKTGSLFHQFASNVQAGKMSLAVGRYSEIHLNRSRGLNIRGFRPDVTGVTARGLKVVEVVSTSQTYSSQVTKIGIMMGKYSHITNGLTLDGLHLFTSWFMF